VAGDGCSSGEAPRVGVCSRRPSRDESAHAWVAHPGRARQIGVVRGEAARQRRRAVRERDGSAMSGEGVERGGASRLVARQLPRVAAGPRRRYSRQWQFGILLIVIPILELLRFVQRAHAIGFGAGPLLALVAVGDFRAAGWFA